MKSGYKYKSLAKRIFQYFFYYSFTLIIVPNLTFWMLGFGCQTVWNQTRPDILLGLIWVQTVSKCYQQTTKVAASEQREELLDTTFWLKPWLKSISFGSNLFDLAKVLAKTNSEPG